MEKERLVNRERELEFLEAYREARAQLIIIYGRSFNPIASF